MKATAGVITKLLKRYNYNTADFTSQQMGASAWVFLGESIAYNVARFDRMVEVLELNGYSVDFNGRRALIVTKEAN